jgi:hypothetical protein
MVVGDSWVRVAMEEGLLVVVVDRGPGVEYPIAPGSDALMHEHADAKYVGFASQFRRWSGISVGVDGPAVYIAQKSGPPKNSLFSKARRQLSGWQSNGRVCLGSCVFVKVGAVVDETVPLLVTREAEVVTVELEWGVAVMEFEETTGTPVVLGGGVGGGTRSVFIQEQAEEIKNGLASQLVIGSGSPVVAVLTDAV